MFETLDVAQYQTDIDYDRLVDASFDQVVAYAQESFYDHDLEDQTKSLHFTYNLQVRAALLANCCSILKLEPSNEQWLFTLTSSQRLLCEACAGAGKTTFAMLRNILALICSNVHGKEILSIAYNTHSRDDITKRFAEIANTLNSPRVAHGGERIKAVGTDGSARFRKALPGELIPSHYHIDSSICSRTFHGWCGEWLYTFASRYNYPVKGTSIVTASESQLNVFMSKVLTWIRDNGNSKLFVSDRLSRAAIGFYNFVCETLSINDPSNWHLAPTWNELQDLSLTELQMMIFKFERFKEVFRVFDFEDYIKHMTELMTKPDVVAQIRDNYKVITVDEYQDITPAMLQVLRLFMEGSETNGIPRYDNSCLTCIGDGDQSIYGFRGTDYRNCLRFRKDYVPANDTSSIKARVVSMSINRRCDSLITQKSREIIESLNERIRKPISSIHDGGSITTLYYTSTKNEMEQLVSKLKSLSRPELDNSCVCFRNTNSARYLQLSLMESGIPFLCSVDGVGVLTDQLAQAIDGVLELLALPDSLEYMRASLYKVLPSAANLRKEDILKLCEVEEVTRKKTKEIRRFWELNWGPWTAINGFNQAMQTLYKAYKAHRSGELMSAYMPGLIDLIKKYFFNWQNERSAKMNNALSEEYIAKVGDMYSRNVTHSAFASQLKKLRQAMANAVEGSSGVYLSTLHGLKGLEFDSVYVIDLADSIFPGKDIRSENETSAQEALTFENESRRLLYVTVTRARHNLTMFFSKQEPSRYVRFFLDATEMGSIYAKLEESANNHYKSNLDTEDVTIRGMRDSERGEFIFADDVAPEKATAPLNTSEFSSTKEQGPEENEFLAGLEDVGDLDNQDKPPILFSEEELSEKVESATSRLLSNKLGEDNAEAISDKPKVRGMLGYILGMHNSD